MRKAAQALHRSQPAISKAIHELEDSLGVALLDRTHRGVEPTKFGTALVRRIRVVFDELQGALRDLADMSDPDSGEVHLGCTETLQAGLVASVVQRVLRQRPGTRVSLESGASQHLIDLLRERRLDFAVARPLTLPLPPEVDGEALFYDELRIVVGEDSPFARRRRLDLAELAGEHWILSRNELSSGSPVLAAFAAFGLAPPERLVVSGSLHTRYAMVGGGRFVTVVPHSLLPLDRPRWRARVLPVTLPAWKVPTMILTIKGRTLSPAAEGFLTTLRELAAPLRSPAPASTRVGSPQRASSDLLPIRKQERR